MVGTSKNRGGCIQAVISPVVLAPFELTEKCMQGKASFKELSQYFSLEKCTCTCAIRTREFRSVMLTNREHLSHHELGKACRCVLKCKQRWQSAPVGCCLTSVPFMLCFAQSHSDSVPLSFCTTNNQLPPPPCLTTSQCYQGLIWCHPLLPPFISSLSSPCCHPMHQPPPDNDVLIMRLLGQKIALQSHSHAVENCCCLGAPTPLCPSGRLTLASCWEQYSGTRAGALSPSL